jgi:ssDNA-binding Zn-finger/Zn-ribbon topoisomerase 1
MGLLDDNVLPPTPEKCQKCKSGNLIQKRGKYGKGDFVGCSRFPKCRFFYPIDNTLGETKRELFFSPYLISKKQEKARAKNKKYRNGRRSI